MEDKTGNKIREDLLSMQTYVVLKAIEKLRQIGSPAFLDDLLNVLCDTGNDDIKAGIISLLDDLKDENAVPVITIAIQNKKCRNDKASLVASCWKSGLNFSSNLNIFLEIFISEEFTTALEAYSVLENNIPNMFIKDADKHINYLKNAEQKISADRKPLADDIRYMLESRKSGII